MNLSNFAIRRPVFTIVTMFLVIILGVVSLLKIPLKLIPEINPPIAVVVTSYEGASPTEVVEKVSKPLEANLATLPGIKNVQSFSEEGSNLIVLEFTWSTLIDDVQNDILQRIDQTTVPADASKPRLLKFDPSQFPVIQLSLKSDTDEESLRKLADQLTTELTRVEGVASVNVTGKLTEEIKITLAQDKLKKYGLSQADIVNLIQANNISMPGETVLTGGKELTTRIISSLHSVKEIEQLVIVSDPLSGDKIRIRDVGQVKQQKQDEGIITRTNELPSVLLSVLQESDANTANVSEDFQKELKILLKKDQFKDIESDILFDQGDYIHMAIGNIASSLVIGGALAMLVLFLFLRNIKSPLIIGIAIPYSVIVTFVLMFFADFALNIMTLGALALGIGMLVDNAIVVIENIYRHLSMGKDPKTAAREGANEVAGAITASTLTTVAVFLPVVFISGLLGQLFKEFAYTISFSLFASLFVALTVIPMLASRLLKEQGGDFEARRRRSKPMNFLDKTIRWSLRHRFFVLFTSLLLFVGGGLGLFTVGMQFLPPTDEGFFSIKLELENGSALSETGKVVEAIESDLKDESVVDTYVSLIGSTQESSFQGTSKSNTAEIYIKLKPLDQRDQSVFEFVDELKPKLEEKVEGVKKGTSMRFNVDAASGIAPQTLTFNIGDTNKSRLDESSDKIFAALKKLKHVTDLSTSTSDKVDEIQITVDRYRALEAGLAPAQIASAVNDVTRGVQATQVISDSSDVYGVYVAYDEKITRDIDKLKTLLIKKPDGGYAELKDIAKIETGSGPVEIQRINQQDSVEFTLKYDTATNVGDMSRKVEKTIADLNLPDETEVTFSGETELLEDSINDMIMAFVLAIILVYIVMAAQFESFKYPFVIMFTVPLMVIGVTLALMIARIPLSIPALIGVIILAGIVVNNAIVIVDYINQRKAAGLSSYEALVVSVKDRARPIFMTALTTILGLVPLALGLGEGTEMNQPMGVAVIGGLISSTFLTLFVIPVVYSLFDPETRSMNRKRKKIR
ncbi:efflux RND transporter permease subunit [Siminovitchia acidinfaciens]|uniref:Efflux RND transporter permease subunit n=1 Tax=Siminovitchia acidinfaciens TaxID=2321395 RepID=A0A429Y2C6_9BACI|nr:efflux RND transporter permease subunit [Siminovitchia acidinfaciens]RST75306.1 efflux RND transporter permease subunit [Siminovitchia acidinfaciens]